MTEEPDILKYLKKIQTIRDGCRECIKTRKELDDSQFPITTPFIKYHQILSDNTSQNIDFEKKEGFESIEDIKYCLDKIDEERILLKEFLEEKGVNMDDVPFSDYPDKICNDLQLAKDTYIKVYQNSVYPGWIFCFKLYDENNVELTDKKEFLQVKVGTNSYNLNYNSTYHYYYFTIQDNIKTQNFIINYFGEKNKYNACSKTIKVTITSSKSTTINPSKIKNNANCTEGSAKKGWTKWRVWNTLSTTSISVCGKPSYSYSIAGRNGTHDTPATLDVYFDKPDMKKLIKLSMTVESAQYPYNTKFDEKKQKITASLNYSGNAPDLQANKAKYGGVEHTGKAPYRCGKDRQDWSSATFSWTKISNSNIIYLYWGTQSTKTIGTNPGILFMKKINIKIEYIPNQTTPTQTSKFNY